MDNSFSISEVGKKKECKSIEIQTEGKLMASIEVQTSVDEK